MNPKLDKNILLAYMYGELSAAECQQVESYLATFPEAKAELDELQHTRSLLANLPEKEVKPPVFIFDPLTKQSPKKFKLNANSEKLFSIGFKRNLSVVAATLLLFFLLAYITRLNVSYHDNELKISFGEPKTTKEEKNQYQLAQNNGLTKEEVSRLIINYLQKDKDSIDRQIALLANRLEKQSLPQNQKTSLANSGQLNNSELKLLLEQIRQDNLQTMLKITKLSAEQQQESVDKMFENFARYYERQREEDLDFIGTSINNLQLNQESTIKRQVMTDQILARLVGKK
jgi:hypothetical protein